MPTGADNTVNITVQVIDANSSAVLTGVQQKLAGVGTAGAAVGTQIQSTTQKMAGMNTAIVRTANVAGTANTQIAQTSSLLLQQIAALQANTAALQAAGSAGANAGASLARGANLAASAHGGLRAQIGLVDNTIRGAHAQALSDVVRLFSRTAVVMAALPIGAVVAGIFLVGEIFSALAEKIGGTESELDKYIEKARESAEQRLVSDYGFEETTAALAQIGDQLDELSAKQAHWKEQWRIDGTNITLPGASFFQYLVPTSDIWSKDQEDKAKELKEKQSAGEKALLEQEQKRDETQIEGEKAYQDLALKGDSKIAADLRDQIDLIHVRNAAKRAEADEDVKIVGGKPNYTSIDTQEAAEIAAAQKRAAGERIAQARTEAEEVIRMQNEATDAGLKGESLYATKVEQDLDAIKRKKQEGEISARTAAAETAAVIDKYDAERLERLEQYAYETKKIQDQAEQAGLSGIAKIQVEGAGRVSELSENPANAGLPDDEKQKRAAALQQQTNAEILQAQHEFTEQMGAIADHNADQVTSGYAKIDAETERSLTHVEQEWEKTYGQIDQSSAIALAGLQEREAAFAQVFENAAREKQKYSEATDRQIATTEAEAARALLPPWQAAQQKIVDDYVLRLEKIRDEVGQHVITEQQGAREVQAAWALAQAEMQKQAEQSRDQLAGQLESFFDNPAKYMEQRAKKVMFDIMANWLEQVSETNPKLQGMLGGIFGLNKVGTGSPANALGTLFGTNHPAAATHELAGAPQLSVAGNTLQAAGVNLNVAARALLAASGTARGPAGVGHGGVGGGGISSTGSAGFPAELGGPGASTPAGLYSGESLGLPTGTSELGGGGINIGSAATAALGIAGGTGAGAGTAGQITGGVEEAVQVGGLLKKAYSSTSAPGSVFSGGDASYGLTAGPGSDESIASGEHTVADEESPGYDDAGGTLDDGNSIDAGSGVSGGPGLVGGALTGITGGLALFGEAESAYNAKSFTGGLLAAGEMGLTGAEIGLTFGGPLGAAIGAVAGFGAGLVTDLFGDHGAARMRQYNVITVIPGLQQALQGFSAGNGSYDSATQAINQIELQAQKSAKSWGTGAMGVYTGTIVPEIDNAEAQVTREGGAGRSLVKFGISQFHAGGVIDDFGSLWTSPTTGFIHAQLGEHITDNMTTAQAMSRSTVDLSSLMRGPARGMAASGSDGGGSPVHIHLHTIDGESTERWLRNGGGAIIQTHLNQRAAKYAGKAVNSY